MSSRLGWLRGDAREPLAPATAVKPPMSYLDFHPSVVPGASLLMGSSQKPIGQYNARLGQRCA